MYQFSFLWKVGIIHSRVRLNIESTEPLGLYKLPDITIVISRTVQKVMLVILIGRNKAYEEAV